MKRMMKKRKLLRTSWSFRKRKLISRKSRNL